MKAFKLFEVFSSKQTPQAVNYLFDFQCYPCSVANPPIDPVSLWLQYPSPTGRFQFWLTTLGLPLWIHPDHPFTVGFSNHITNYISFWNEDLFILSFGSQCCHLLALDTFISCLTFPAPYSSYPLTTPVPPTHSLLFLIYPNYPNIKIQKTMNRRTKVREQNRRSLGIA